MNAKKIMGAVLVALLAAALFVGAGAAVDATKVESGQTVFLYQNITNGTAVTEAMLQASWTSLDGKSTIKATVTADGSYYFAPTENFVDGTYESAIDETKKLNIMKPAAVVSIVAGTGDSAYPVVDGISYEDEVTYTISNLSTSVELGNLIITAPNGVADMKAITALTGKIPTTNDGEYKVQVTFNASYFVIDTPAGYLKTPVYTFTVADANDVTISVNTETVTVGDSIALTIKGKPNGDVTVNLTKFNLTSWGEVKAETVSPQVKDFTFKMPKTGQATVYVEAVSNGNGKIKVEMNDVEETLEITINKGTITAETDKEAYFIGDKVVLSGTSSTAKSVNFYWAGTNKDFDKLNNSAKQNSVSVNNGKWEFKLEKGLISNVDAGTYTVYVVATPINTALDIDDQLSETTYTTVSLVLKQPFISVTDAPSVAVKGTEYEVVGTAEAAQDIYAYIFGTNFFAAANTNGAFASGSITGDDFEVELDKNEFTITVDVPTGTYDMAIGQYFMVVQHPMYDKVFNLAPVDKGINKNATGDATKGNLNNIVMTVEDRQKANAAQALCDELDAQNIDDMYVKLSFVVAAQESVINPIPTEVTQGSKLTVSGTTNLGEGETVTVEIVSSAFAAIPKEQVGSASFISIVTKTDEDGNWEVTFDTTGLKIDEYIVTAAVADLNKATAKVNVIEGAPTEQPTENPTEQPTQTEQPTEAPATPGFGALAALAGLGAVAVLLLRRE